MGAVPALFRHQGYSSSCYSLVPDLAKTRGNSGIHNDQQDHDSPNIPRHWDGLLTQGVLVARDNVPNHPNVSTGRRPTPMYMARKIQHDIDFLTGVTLPVNFCL